MSGHISKDTTKRTRSRFGCHRCKRLKVKCDEQKPACSLCVKANHQCDYSIKLTWGGRPFKKQKPNNLAFGTVVSFEQKYNKGEKSQQFEQVIDFSTPPPSEEKPAKKEPSKTQSPIIIQEHPIAPHKGKARLKVSSHIMTQLPTPSDSVGFETASPQLPPQDRLDLPSDLYQMTTMNQKNDTDLMMAFRDLETANPFAKQFVNNVLLPDLTALDQELALHEEEDSSPEYHMTIFDTTFHNCVQDTDSPPDLFHNPQRFFTGFETIPEILTPLPDLLRKNPLYKRHYHSYIEVFSKMLCPAPPRAYKDNPFTCILPQMSLSAGTEGILAVLISFSLCQTTVYTDDPYPKELIQDLLRRALSDLYNRLTDPQEANSDYTLALILVLSSFEIICGKEHGWRAHYFGAKNIMISRGLLKAAFGEASTVDSLNSVVKAKPVSLERGSESDLSYFFTRWFAYLNVIGSLSSSSSVYTETAIAGEFLWETPLSTTLDRERLQDIDPFMGFDLKLLEHFSTIINLVKEREISYSSAETLSVNIIQQALETKEKLMRYLEDTDRERTEIEAKLVADPLNVLNDRLPDYKVLRSTNLIFGLSGVLQIYRRILMMPKESPLVQDVVRRITDAIAKDICKEQPAAYCTIFSLFSCGCEVLDEPTRAFFLDRMNVLAENGLLSARIAHDIMLESWETGKYWADIIAERQVDVVFL